ncbi:cyclin-like protein [Nitzschia inconspicua]|uniref:Cyclin-like protein n=1 Tax=Nitzschia inconspicua TaxID=303405 RepID=A0A9K3KQT4_9STRA|nr:cyclin-like protein [Nitzschia inconspicua]
MATSPDNNVEEMDESVFRIRAMLSQETSVYTLQSNYLLNASVFATSRRRSRPGFPVTPPVDASCRVLMAKWCNSLCDFCKYDRDVTAAAMSCVDRFASTPSGMETILMDRDRYQLAVMTGLYLIAKIQQGEALDPESVAKLSRGKHSKADIENMEMEMLVGLQWRVNPPTPWTFARELLNLIPTSVAMEEDTRERIYELTKYQLEVAVLDYDLSFSRSSELAFGAILNAMESLSVDFAIPFETSVSQLLKTEVHQLRGIRMGLLKVISEDASVQPMCAVLTQRTSVMASYHAPKNDSFSCVNSSPKSVSATIQ